MRLHQIFLLLSLKQALSLSLHYDYAQHFYDELLISISPDVPGLSFKTFINVLKLYFFLEIDRDITIENIKKWITEE